MICDKMWLIRYFCLYYSLAAFKSLISNQGMKDPIFDSKTKVSVVNKHINEIVIKELDAGKQLYFLQVFDML